MRTCRSAWTLAAAAGLVALSGASCPFRSGQTVAHHPVLPPAATLEQVIEAVNRNNAQITSFSTPQAEIGMQGMPGALKGPMAFERPKRFRFRGGTLVTGPEIDLGSNDELFWIWARRGPQPGVYFCRHDRFDHSPIRQMVPIEPDWLVEALGVGTFDPSLPHQGPYALKDGRLEVRTIRETEAGPMTKVTIIDPQHGWIVGQYLFDPQGQVVASSVAREHRVDPLTNLWIARRIDVHCPAVQFALRMDLGNVQINRLAGEPRELWSMPRYEDYPLVDLGDPNLQLQSTAPAHQASMPRAGRHYEPPRRAQSPAGYRRAGY